MVIFMVSANCSVHYKFLLLRAAFIYHVLRLLSGKQISIDRDDVHMRKIALSPKNHAGFCSLSLIFGFDLKYVCSISARSIIVNIPNHLLQTISYALTWDFLSFFL